MTAIGERKEILETEIPELMAGMEQEISALEGKTVTLIGNEGA